MKLFKVLAVDDDLPILQSLRDFPWEKCGCRLAGEAQNGDEALAQCQILEPDIVITDIVMPVIDGIELIKCLRSCNPYVQIIIITSYRDFEYAKEAIHLGVKEYLIKGIYTDEELSLAIGRAKDAFDKETSSMKYKNESDLMMKNETLVNILVQKASPESKDVQLFLKLPARFVMLHLAWNITPGILTERRLSELLFSYKTAHMPEFIIFSSHEIHLLYGKEPDIHPVLEDVKRLMTEIENAFHWCSLKCFASVGNVACSMEQYKTEVKETKNILHKRFYYGKSAVFTSHPIKFRLLTKEEKQQLNHALKKYTLIEEQEYYLRNEFIDYLMTNSIDPEDVKLLFFSWFSEMLEQNTPEDNPLFMNEAGYELCISDFIDRYLSLCSHVHHSVFPEGRYEISKALKIINENMAGNLNADSIAGEIGLSPNYFGYIFKKYTGQNFKEYMTRVRMEKAMLLIKNTNMKVYEIAEQVGIPNYRYFISVFQKYFNKNPSDVKGGK